MLRVASLLLALVVASTADAAGTDGRRDLHEYWDQRCGTCHGRPLGATLSTHDGVSAADLQILIGSLTRIQREVVPARR